MWEPFHSRPLNQLSQVMICQKVVTPLYASGENRREVNLQEEIGQST